MTFMCYFKFLYLYYHIWLAFDCLPLTTCSFSHLFLIAENTSAIVKLLSALNVKNVSKKAHITKRQ